MQQQVDSPTVSASSASSVNLSSLRKPKPPSAQSDPTPLSPRTNNTNRSPKRQSHLYTAKAPTSSRSGNGYSPRISPRVSQLSDKKGIPIHNYNPSHGESSKKDLLPDLRLPNAKRASRKNSSALPLPPLIPIAQPRRGNTNAASEMSDLTDRGDAWTEQNGIDASVKLSLRCILGYTNGNQQRCGREVAIGASRGWSSRTLLCLGDGRLAYAAASFVILCRAVASDAESGFRWIQSIFASHSSSVSSMASHPDDHMIASAEVAVEGKIAKVLVWDSTSVVEDGSSCEVLADLPLTEQALLHGVIRFLSFSGDGRLLLVGGSEDGRTTTMAVFDWVSSQLIVSCKLGSMEVSELCFNQHLYRSDVDDEEVSNDIDGKCTACYTLLSSGVTHVKFWTLKKVYRWEEASVDGLGASAVTLHGRKVEGPSRRRRWVSKWELEGSIGKMGKTVSGSTTPDIMCVATVDGGEESHFNSIIPSCRILTGTSIGSILIWRHSTEKHATSTASYWLPKGSLISVVMDVHDGPIRCLSVSALSIMESESDGSTSSRFAACSDDGTVSVWRFTDMASSMESLPIEFISSLSLDSEGESEDFGKPLEICWWTHRGDRIVLGTSKGCVCVTSGLTVPNEESSSNQEQDPWSLEVVTDGRGCKAKRVSPHPSEQLVLTLTSGKLLCLWDLRLRGSERALGFTQIPNNCTCICWSPDGRTIAVGSESGEVMVLSCTVADEENGKNNFVCWEVQLRRAVAAKSSGIGKSDIASGRHKGRKIVDGGAPSKDMGSGAKYVSELKYSPSGEILAVGTKNGQIHILSTQVLFFTYMFRRALLHVLLYLFLEFLPSSGCLQWASRYNLQNGFFC